jgi:hypothetical protein
MSVREEQRIEAFKRETRGMGAWKIAQAMNRATPGIDFRGCNKGQLAKAFADGEASRVSVEALRDGIRMVRT